jgi:hypothetical protein
MKAAFRTLMALAIVFAAIAVARAEDDKDGKKTLKGEMGCAKCVFKVVKGACKNAIKVKEGDKEVIYILDDKGAKEKYHKKICTDTAKGTVTGTVSKKDGKNYIKPDKGGVKIED